MTDLRASDLYRLMLSAREIDLREQTLISQNLAHFHVSGAGHEASAALAGRLTPHDWLHLHYRDKALMLARGLPIEEFFRSLLGRGGSHSCGRQMSAHFSSPSLKITSLVGPVGNNALQAVGVAAAIRDQPRRPIVVCSVGDGTTQQGEFLEAVAEAVRWRLPVLFWVEDNRWSISTSTRGQTLFDLPTGPAAEFYGLPIQRMDGGDVISVDARFGPLVAELRESRRPQLVVLAVERLASHTNADDQTQYRTADEILHARDHGDPLVNLRGYLLRNGIAPHELDDLHQSVRQAVYAASEKALLEPEPTAVFSAKAPLPPDLVMKPEYLGDASTPRLTMREAMCGVLRQRLAIDPRVFLYGQDIEDPKGDVFGVTRGLSNEFPGRVVNSPLSEATIVGASIGRALAGQRPVAFIQFADFLPLAFNQIVSELGSMYWRTNGGWQCPVILMVACGGYKAGLGPFHAQTMDGFAVHVPGIDVVMPSFAADAAGLLNAALDSPRPTIFFYPKTCLNLSGRDTSADLSRQFVPPGKARRLATGADLTLVTWGAPVAACEKTVQALASAGQGTDLFDLRSLAPWDEATVLASAEKTGRLVVVHEDNQTCGFGAELLATVGERTRRPVRMRRVTRPDTYIPYHPGNQLEVLPSFPRILEVCADLLDFDVTWEKPPPDPPEQATIRAIGSGPADESVEVIALRVHVGDDIAPGQVVAEIEATKAVVEIRSLIAGTVIEILAAAGRRLPVGAGLIRLTTNHGNLNTDSQPEEGAGTARLVRRNSPVIQHQSRAPAVNTTGVIYASRPACALGGRIVSSESLAANIAGWTAAEVVKRTGVASRHWKTEAENVVSLAIQAARNLLSTWHVEFLPITAIICSTTTPREASPSVACQVATSLRDQGKLAPRHAAFDFNAACSGYLYGLRIAGDLLKNDPDGRVLLITSEVTSQVLDPLDAATVFLFGDAATATLISTEFFNDCLIVYPPILSAAADPEMAIQLPCPGTAQFLRMDGIAVARTAYKAMGNAVRSAVAEAGISLAQIAALIPHPGSKRISQNVADYLNISPEKVWTTLADTGNTSSSSIPLAIERHWDQLPRNGFLALAAFGAGFTTAAAIASKGGATE